MNKRRAWIGYFMRWARGKRRNGGVGQNTQLVVETVNTGGEGGKPAGGGGGGGVLGPGSAVIVTGSVTVDGKDGEFPGGGGGGGGVVAPDTMGYDPAERNGTEGVGLSGGVDGRDGGDSFISTADGTILAFAPGGKAGLAGTGIRLTSERLAVSSLLLCNYREIMMGGLASMVGAGWQSCRVLNIGDVLTFPVFVIIEAGGVPEGEYTIIVKAHSPSGVVYPVSFPITVKKSGDLLRIARCVDLGATVDLYGLWTLTVSSELKELASMMVMVKRFGEPDVWLDQVASPPG